MTLLNDLIKVYFGSQKGELLIGGVGVTELARTYGTPIFVYDRTILERKYELLRKTYPPEFSIFYSIKANPNPTIVKFFVTRGCGLEIASMGELALALSSGCPAEKILFAGPGKTESEIEEALRNKIGELHAESFLEIKRIGKISSTLGIKARVAIRVNPGKDAEGGAMRMGGKPTPFGIDEEVLDSAIDLVLDNSHIDLQGIHIFSGTQILDHRTLLRQYANGLEIVRRVTTKLHHSLKTVDFGGGLGVPYFEKDIELDMPELGAGLEDLMRPLRDDPSFRDTRFIIEPGRYLSAESGIYVSTINDIKTSRGKKFYIVNGGMHHHLAASGNLGQTIKRNFPVSLANKLDSNPTEVVDVVGALCTPLDVLARNSVLPEAEVGDLFAIFQSGAYARTASPLGFLSHPFPREIMVNQNDFQLI